MRIEHAFDARHPFSSIVARPLGRRLDSFPDIAVFAPVISLFRTNCFPDIFPVPIPAPLPQVIEGTPLFGTKQAEMRAIFPASRVYCPPKVRHANWSDRAC